MVRTGFTFIELIFAIVIISITALSLPMMTQVTSQGVDNALVQEAIFAGATELNEAVSFHWDENSFESNTTEANTTNSYSRIICSTGARNGLISEKLHRRCLNTNAAVSNSSTNDDVKALDDAEHGATLIFTNAPDAAGYKEPYESTLSVAHSDFAVAGNSADIKKITISVYDENSKLVTQLNTYSANIGEVDYHKRSFK